MLTHIILMATLAATPASQVLVLKSGAAMVVKSYKVDGALVRIVGSKGEPLVMRLNKIDVEASQAATERRAARDIPEPASKPVRRARAPVARQTLLGASQVAIKRGSSGGMSVAEASAPRSTPKASSNDALIERGPAPRATDGLPDGKDTAGWQVLFDGLRNEWDRQTARLRQLARRYKTMDVAWRDVHGRHHIDPSAMVERGAIGAQIQSVKATLVEIGVDFADLKEYARRAGVKPVVYRSGLK